MSSATKYILYVGLLHLALAVLLYTQLDGKLFLLAEVGLLLSAYAGYRIYRSLIAPLRLMAQGAAALEDQDFSVKLLPTGSKEMDKVVGIYNQMIDQLRSERVSGRQREEFLDQIIKAAGIGIVVLDFDGNVSSTNAWTEKRRQREDFNRNIIAPALHPEFDQATLTDSENRRYQVERSYFLDRNFERSFLIIQDVTAELLAAEKEAYGRVIRMMAHEVNNSNAAIVSLLRTLLEAESAELNGEYLPIVIERAEHMTGFMRNFARVVRLPAADRKRTELNALLHRTGEVMASIFERAGIELSYRLSPREVWIEADAAHLEQVVINALTNARESIGKGGGHVRISSASSPPSFVIEDDGPGIPAEVVESLFTPFFSNKTTGQGIGLTLTREILEAHGATYSLATEEDGRTRLRVRFAN